MMWRDQPSRRHLKAIVISAVIHLALIVLIHPARQVDPSVRMLHARITPAPTQPAAPPVKVTGVNDDPPVPPAAEMSPPPDLATTHAPAPAQAAPPEAEADGMQRTDEEAPARSEERQATLSGPPSGLPEIPVMLDTQWYTARQVDRRPELLTTALPVYPEEARTRGIEGSVVVEVHIDEYGKVREIAVLEANPPGIFDAAVLEVYSKAQFSPAILQGRPVRYLGRYQVLFELD